LQEFRSSGVQEFRSSGVAGVAGGLEDWSNGVLEYWSIGGLEDWRTAVLECWSVGGLEAKQCGGGTKAHGLNVVARAYNKRQRRPASKFGRK